MTFTLTALWKTCVLLAFLFLPLTAHAGKTKSFKLEFYNNEIDKNYSVIRATDRPALATKTFVCELVNVFDPDERYEVQKFDFTVRTKAGKESYAGLDEEAFLGTIKLLKSPSPGSPVAVVTVTKVYYRDRAKAEKTMGGDRFDYADISVR